MTRSYFLPHGTFVKLMRNKHRLENLIESPKTEVEKAVSCTLVTNCIWTKTTSHAGLWKVEEILSGKSKVQEREKTKNKLELNFMFLLAKLLIEGNNNLEYLIVSPCLKSKFKTCVHQGCCSTLLWTNFIVTLFCNSFIPITCCFVLFSSPL